MAKKPTEITKRYGRANTYEPVWIAWFDELDRLQVERFTPIWANERKVRFAGQMLHCGFKQTVNRTPRIAATREAALKALYSVHRAKHDEYHERLMAEADRLELIKLELDQERNRLGR